MRNLLNSRKNWVIPYVAFMAFFIVIPLILIGYYAFMSSSGALTFENFEKFGTNTESLNIFIYSIGIALITTFICIVLGYPAAYILSNNKLTKWQFMIVLFILPMWVNMLIRTLATVALFDFLKIPLGEGALIFGMVYNFIPFMIYPIYNSLTKIDKSLLEAAQDLGATNRAIFTKVIFPLSMPGVLSGVLMVFMPVISTFAISELLTLNNIRLFGSVIQENINNGAWNYGAALSLIMLLIIGFTTFLNNQSSKSESEAGLI
ncbi:Spermidine Putrescine ABC transporter permease component PotB [Mucinivorans hirudinis]|uniref:Spermidine Putrescine ABC transporter permease component PotB n=1 Tax=Mucinivorans hirudinis TaxID=1433126 RepID=A0A060R9A0_9BACT|nr:Spermidine Putrescine ABC transporter permease component PotB [Mucinivorans hirudinis]